MFAAAKNAVTGQVAESTMGPPHWQDGICSCCDDTGICCQTFWCYQCTFSNMINKRETGAGVCDCATCFCFMVAEYVSSYNYAFWAGMGIRRAIVERYGIKNESTCSTCMLGHCCAPCSWCQIQREMGKRNEHCGGCCAKAPANAPSIADKLGAAAMNVIGHAVVNNGRMHQPGPWQSGICDCDIMDCCEGYWCGCCVLGFIGNKIDGFHAVAGADAGIDKLDPLSCCGALWAPQAMTYQNRRELVERYNIIGETHLKSLCMVLCCPFCTPIQQRREMGYRGEWPGGLCVKAAPMRR